MYAVLILHGWNLSASKYLPLRNELTKRGYKVYCPDLPGFGKSKYSGKSYSLTNYINFTKNFLQENNLKKVVLIGHSFGGRIGIKFAKEYSQYLNALILSGVPGIVPVPRAKIIFFLYLAKLGHLIFSIPILSLFKNTARKYLYKTASASDFYNTKDNLRQTFKNIVKENLKPYLPIINVPTLLIWGRKDGMVPIKIAEKMNKIITNSKLVIIEDGRHDIPWTHPKEFADEVEKFLSSAS